MPRALKAADFDVWQWIDPSRFHDGLPGCALTVGDTRFS